MGRYSGKTCRLLTMLSLTLSFFIVEILVGYMTNSLALVGDAYHMLSDCISLLVGFASVRISKWESVRNTFGWARAEVLGALVNSVFLIALCFTIFVEAIQRMFHDEHIHDPVLMLIVGGIGLFINIIGLFLFSGHAHGHSHGGGGHSHAGHGHSHGAHGHDHEEEEEKIKIVINGDVQTPDSEIISDDEDKLSLHTSVAPNGPHMVSSSQLNMKGVFLHVLGDALGSVIVIISALCVMYIEADWKHKIDPAMSLLLVIIISCTTIPLFKESSLILLQTVPTHIKASDLQEKLVLKVEGVIAVHELHIWQLAGNRVIASAHIQCRNLNDYQKIAEQVKTFFHNEGIHSTTIQPEFSEEVAEGRDCVLECGPDKLCYPDTCCAKKIKNGGDPSSQPEYIGNSTSLGVRQRLSSVSLTQADQAPKGSPEPSTPTNVSVSLSALNEVASRC